MNLHFDCVFYYVSDLDRAVAFYRDVLGFALQSRDQVARFKVDEVLLELVPGAEGRRGGNARVCLRVEELDTTIATLRRRGVAVGQPQQKTNGLLVSFSDPDGNELCLWQYAQPAARP